MDDAAELIGSMNLIGVQPDGTEQRFLVGVGAPVREPTGEWACPTLIPDFEVARPIRGEHSLQALCMGLSFIRRRLEDYLEQGGRLFWPEGGDEVSRSEVASIFSPVGGACDHEQSGGEP